MVDITQIDHVEVGLSLLPAQWDNAPIFRSVIQSYLTELNQTEADILNVRDGFNIFTAIGKQLDIIGTYFDVSRSGRGDEEYRDALLSKITNNNGSGTPDDVLNLLDTIAGNDGSKIWEHYPLASIMSNPSETSLNFPSLIQEGFPAGVEIQGIIFTEEMSYVPAEGLTTQAILETHALDTVEVISEAVPYDLELNAEDYSVNTGGFSEFVDSSQDATEEQSGWGLNWGGNWGGFETPFYTPLPDMADADNTLLGTNSTFIPWAEMSEYDPLTGTTNKIKPKVQFQNTGLKAKQPLPRQFFNWMIATISDWLGFFSTQFAVGTIFKTVNSPLADIPAAEAELGTRLGGTWTYAGTGSLGTVTAYYFERTA